MLCQYHYKTTVHKMDGPNQGQTYTSPQSGRTPPRVKSSPRNGRTQPGSNLYESTRWTDPTKGQDQSTKWMDPTRVKLIRVHKVDGPHQGSKLIQVHKVNGPHQGSKLVHKMDGPNQGQTYTNPRSGRTQPGHKIILVHEVDDHIKGHDPIPRNEWTQPWSLIQHPQWTNNLVSRPIHKVDRPNHCQLI